MALDSISELHDGRVGADSVSTRSSTETFIRRFRVIMTSQFDGPSEVKAAMPSLGVSHPDNVFATCVRRRAASHNKAKKVWIGTAEYSTAGPKENPFDEPAVIQWSTTSAVEPFYKDSDDDAILNRAGDYYEEGLKDDVSRWTISICVNVPFMPAWVDGYKDAINEDAVIIDGFPVAAETARISGIRLGKWESRNDIAYRVFDLEIKLKDSWTREVLDQGMHCKDPNNAAKRLRCVNDDGTPSTKLKLLDGNGAQLANPSPANAVFNEHDIRNLQPFSVLPLN